MTAPIVLRPGQGTTAPGARQTLKARAEDSNGTLTVIETTIEPGRSIPAHIHANEEEAWYVIEGTLTFYLGEVTHAAPAGSFVLVPRGTAHGFANKSDAPARFIELFTPAGMERYFEERHAAARAAAPSGVEVDYAGIDPRVHAEIAGKYGMTFV
jgi:quercetin dioxygenase-like cupin family protein